MQTDYTKHLDAVLSRGMREYYLDYTNNFLTVSAFADNLHISDDAAAAIIKAGRIAHEAYVKEAAA